MWLEQPLDAPAWKLLGHPSADGAWVESDERWFHVSSNGAMRLVDVEALQPPDPMARLDGFGRLVQRQDDGLWRYAVDRPMEVVGITSQDVVEVDREVTVLPTAPAEVVTLDAVLIDATGAEVPVAIDDNGAMTLQPLGLLFGTWTLRATATYDDAPDGLAEVTVQMAAATGATWTEHIAPIYDEACSLCHDGATETVLDSPEAWEADIDGILEKVISAEMPLGGPPLTDQEIALIQAWQAGGFSL